MSNFICNVLIMGATGAGKSSLLNYLCGENVAKTGAGKPVTEEGIFEFDVSLNGQAVRLYDSWGIEADKVEKWKSSLSKELTSHGADKPIEKWFHSVIYCIQAGGARIQSIDSEKIKLFLEKGYNVVIVLTKADQVSDEAEARMEESIRNEVESSIKEGKICNVIPCCTVKKKTRSGVTQPFGRDEIIDQIIRNWWYTVLDRLPWHVIGKMEDEIDRWGEETKNKILNDYKIYGNEKDNLRIKKKLEDEFDAFSSHLNSVTLPEAINEAVGLCNIVSNALCVIFGRDNSSEAKCQKDIKIDLDEFLRILGRWFRGCYNIKNIEKQKNMIVESIDGLTEELKEAVRSREKQIKIQIENSILII